MVEFIQKEVKKIMTSCIERNAKKSGLQRTEVQLALKLKDADNVGYVIYEKYQPKEEVEFTTGVLGVRIDFKGYSLIAPPFIRKSLHRFCESESIGIGAIRVMCLLTDDIQLYLYNNAEFVKQISLEDLFNSEDVEEE